MLPYRAFRADLSIASAQNPSPVLSQKRAKSRIQGNGHASFLHDAFRIFRLPRGGAVKKLVRATRASDHRDLIFGHRTDKLPHDREIFFLACHLAVSQESFEKRHRFVCLDFWKFTGHFPRLYRLDQISVTATARRNDRLRKAKIPLLSRHLIQLHKGFQNGCGVHSPHQLLVFVMGMRPSPSPIFSVM